MTDNNSAPERIWASSVLSYYGDWQSSPDGMFRPVEYVRSDLCAADRGVTVKLTAAEAMADTKDRYQQTLAWLGGGATPLTDSAALVEALNDIYENVDRWNTLQISSRIRRALASREAPPAVEDAS